MSDGQPGELETRIRALRDQERLLEDELAALRNEPVAEHDAIDEADHEDIAAADGMQRKGGSDGHRRITFKRAFRYLALLTLAVALIVGVPHLLNYLDSYESTDDAQIDGHIAPISSRINGTVQRVYVRDTEFVEAGKLLVEIDPRDEQATVDTARANLAQATAQLDAARADYNAAASRVDEARATAKKAERDASRYTSLAAQHIVSASDYDEKVSTAEVDDAAVQSARAAANSAKTAIASRQAGVNAAQAALDQALLGLEYTKIVAPTRGVVGKKTVEVGQHVQPGEQLVAIVSLDDIWITADFKETQLRKIRTGQRVTIHVDATGGDYRGYVEGLAGASGEKYSLLPPENATGNYVKVVQRLPVRIRLFDGQDVDHRLRPGMSAEPSVWLR
jgi:membrane fusion protein (multidrug efflux system)